MIVREKSAQSVTASMRVILMLTNWMTADMGCGCCCDGAAAVDVVLCCVQEVVAVAETSEPSIAETKNEQLRGLLLWSIRFSVSPAIIFAFDRVLDSCSNRALCFLACGVSYLPLASVGTKDCTCHDDCISGRGAVCYGVLCHCGDRCDTRSAQQLPVLFGLLSR